MSNQQHSGAGESDSLGESNNGNGDSPPQLNSTKELFALASLTKLATAHPLETARIMALGAGQYAPRLFNGFSPDRDMVDQTGKVILVTGGNGGLGKEIIVGLAKQQPARIYLAARNEKKAKEALSYIHSQLTTPVDIRYLPLDLVSIKSVRAAASQFISECDRLDTLVLNAGIMAPPPSTTEDGFEIQMGTNHIGHFLLTQLLLSTLRRTAAEEGGDVRVVSVSSIGWQMGPPFSVMTSPDQLRASDRWVTYGASKAANILFAAEMARRYPEITTVSVHPGVILTELFNPAKEVNFLVRFGVSLLRPIAVSERQGACNTLWAAGSDKAGLCNGDYYSPIGVKAWGNPFVQNAEQGRIFWEWTEEQIYKAENGELEGS